MEEVRRIPGLKVDKEGRSIINTTSVTAYEGNRDLIDYSATKGMIAAPACSLSLSLAEKGIRMWQGYLDF